MEMKKYAIWIAVALWSAFAAISPGGAQETEQAPKQFTVLKEVWRTPYKPQGKTGMCWAFSTTSFLESELKRLGRGEFELSQAFTAYHAYLEKSRRYVRRQGGDVFGQGGLPHDVIHVMRNYGAVPLAQYTGLVPGREKHDHNELFAILNGLVRAVVKMGEEGNLSGTWTGGRVQSAWMDDFRDVLDNHLGAPPATVTFKGRSLTPRQFADDVLAIPFDDYVEVTSYSYLPRYGAGELALHDNWLHFDRYYNVPLDDYIRLIDSALENGFSMVFDLHTTPELYKSRLGYAELSSDLEGSTVNQDARDTMLEDWQTTDVHLVHCVGLAEDDSGKRFYRIKDSWGADEGPYEDLEYLSENFVRAKALFIMIHKDGLPKDLRKKLGIE
jgi:bleomycin hydrolase